MCMDLRAAAWLLALGVGLVPAHALQTTGHCAPITMSLLAQADIRLSAPMQESPSLLPAPSATIQVTPTDPSPPALSSGDDEQIAAELVRLRERALAVTPGDRKSRPALRAAAGEAAWTLGLIHLHGSGVTQNPVTARHWFETANSLGFPQAAAGLAWCEIDGCGGPAKPSAARVWLAQLRKARPEKAAYLEWLLESRTSPLDTSAAESSSSASNAGRRNILIRSARAGEPQARNELGLELAYAMRLEEALAYFKSAAEKSPAAEANVLIVEALQGKEEKNATQRSRATQALTDAKRFHRGEGVFANYNEAIRLYREAEALGSEEARRMLALILSRSGSGPLNVEWMRQLAWIDLSNSVPRSGSPAVGSVLQRDPSPLFDWTPLAWQKRVLKIQTR